MRLLDLPHHKKSSESLKIPLLQKKFTPDIKKKNMMLKYWFTHVGERGGELWANHMKSN